MTLFAEFGICAAFAWISFIVYALIRGIKKTSAWCAFAGLVLSASAASVFDWSVLFDFQEYGTLPLSNYLLSWLTLFLFLGLGIYLAWGKTSWKRPAPACGIALVVCLSTFVFYSGATPKIRDGFIVKAGAEMPLVLHDENWTVKTVLPFFKDGYRIPLSPGKHIAPMSETVWFFGNAAEYAKKFPDVKLIFVSPPEFFIFPANTTKVWLKRFGESCDFNCDLKYY